VLLLTQPLAWPDEAQAVDRGIVDNRLETVADVDLASIPTLAYEMGGSRLRARWTRVLVHWARLQPHTPGEAFAGDANGDGYVDSYVNELSMVVGELAANGVKVILTPTEVPYWASDRDVWISGYSHAFAMEVGDPVVLREFGRLGGFLTTGLGTPVRYLECWNEPNTGGTFYPQTRNGDRYWGMRVYVKMLRAFHGGVKAAAPSAAVIAGATAPRGANDDYSTSPRTFATYLRDHGAQRYFDAYSHHPYCWGPPSMMPRDSKRTVWLANLSALTKLFPRRPFHLTEFGYGTYKPTLIGMDVSPATQARYLRQAYSYVAARYPQVRSLLWFMVQDLAPTSERLGAYMGLSTLSGAPKPAWYAFAGGNALTSVTPASVASRATFTVSGTLVSRVLGGLAGKTLRLQMRQPGRPGWRTLKTTLTAADGVYAFRLQQRSTTWYRVIWDGVCESRPRSVRTP